MAELTRLQQDIINFYHQNPFTEYIQAKVIPTAGGGVRLELTVEAEHTNLYGIVHGGVLMTLADTACGAACLAKNKRVVTISLGMDFMHSIPLTTKIIAIGRVLHWPPYDDMRERDPRRERQALRKRAWHVLRSRPL